MRYLITSQQLNYLRKEGYIEYEDFFTPETAQNLKEILDLKLSSILQEKFTAGRDLHQTDPALLKALNLPKLGQIASALFIKKSLRLAFTQYYPLYPEALSAEQFTSMTEVCGCALIDLNPEHAQFGVVTFCLPSYSIPFPSLEMPYLLLAFATDTARYQYQEKDPHTHLLKKLGYAFGDRITVETHPLIIKGR